LKSFPQPCQALQLLAGVHLMVTVQLMATVQLLAEVRLRLKRRRSAIRSTWATRKGSGGWSG